MYYIEKFKSKNSSLEGYYLMKNDNPIAYASKKKYIYQYCKENNIQLNTNTSTIKQ